MINPYKKSRDGEIATANLLKTFRRFGITKPSPFEEMMESMMKMSAQMFGSPSQLIVDPNAFTGLLGQLSKKDESK